MIVRPDGRRFVSLGSGLEDLYARVDENDGEARRVYEALGFVAHRRESEYLIPTDPEISGLRGVEVPAGFAFVPADQAEEERLRLLDDALRQDVPGTDGWRWDEAGFREEFDSSFDPATYLVAVDEASGEYVGLARVWNKPAGPRLGLVAVLAPYRRRGLAKALLARIFGLLHGRGQAEVSADVDETNVASKSLLLTLRARRTGGSLELIRPARPDYSQPRPSSSPSRR